VFAAWLCGVYAHKLNVAITAALVLLVSSVVAYYIIWGVGMHMAIAWSLIAIPTAAVTGAAGYFASKDHWAAPVCAAVPLGCVLPQMMWIRSEDTLAALLLLALALLITSRARWRKNPQLFVVSVIGGAATFYLLVIGLLRALSPVITGV